MRRLFALSVLLLAAAAPSFAATNSGDFIVFFSGQGKPIADWQGPLHVSGSLRVDYQGDGVSGTLTWTPGSDGGADLEKLRLDGRVRWAGALSVNQGDSAPAVTVVTHRRQPDGSDAACLDAAGTAPDLLAMGSGRRSLPVSLAGQFSPGEPLAARCAGPLTSDIARVLPRFSVAPGRLRRGTKLDFTATRPFAAGGFSGTATSTLVVRVGHMSRESQQGASIPHLPGVKTVKHVIRTVDVEYHVVRVRGALGIALRGAASGSCEQLDSCATGGTVAVSPRAIGARASLAAFSSNAHRGFAALRGALGLGPFRGTAGITVSGSIMLLHAAVAETLHRDDGSSCADRLSARNLFVGVSIGRHRITATGQDLGDSLRTRCPGPLAGEAPLWTGSLPRSALGRRQLTIRLTRHHSLSDDGWLGRTTGALSITLRRGAMHAHRQTFLAPAF